MANSILVLSVFQSLTVQLQFCVCVCVCVPGCVHVCVCEIQFKHCQQSCHKATDALEITIKDRSHEKKKETPHFLLLVTVMFNVHCTDLFVIILVVVFVICETAVLFYDIVC